MKAILEFNLPEDREEYNIVNRYMDFYLVCCDLDQALRNWEKYGHSFKTPEETLARVREKFMKILDDRNITLDMSL